MKWSNYLSKHSISCALDNKQEQAQKLNRGVLMQMFSSLGYLTRQGLATRGHTDTQSNYHQLLRLRALDSPDLQKWLISENYSKWLGHDIESEMLRFMSHSVLRELAREIQVHGYFSLIVDETSDISCVEQVSICIRHIDDNLTIHEDFIGMYAMTDAITLV